MKKGIILSESQTKNISDGITQVLGEDNENELKISVNLTKKKINAPDFIMLFQEISRTIVPKLKPTTCQVLLYIFGNTEYGNYTAYRVQKIADDLGYKRNAIGRAIKELKDFGVLLSIANDTDHRSDAFTINPHVAWRGTIQQRGKIIKQKPTALKQLNQFNIFPNNSEGNA